MNAFHTTALAAAALLLLGCPTHPCSLPPICSPSAVSRPVCVDSAFSPAEQAQVIGAVGRWDAAICDMTRLSSPIADVGSGVPDDCSYVVMSVQSWYPWVADRPLNSVAFSEPGRGIAWIVVDVVPAGLLRAAVEHELGALLGATDDEGGGVMGEPLRDTCIWKASVEEIRVDPTGANSSAQNREVP